MLFYSSKHCFFINCGWKWFWAKQNCESHMWVSQKSVALIVKCHWCALLERGFKIHKFSPENELILIFSRAQGKKNQAWRALRWCLLILLHPTAASEKVDSWIDKPMKKSERAHLNGFDYSSPQPCLWFWKGGEYRGFCLWTDAKPSGQAGNRRARQRGRDRHEAIMKMNANGGEGSHGRSRSMEKGVLKTVCLRSTQGLTVTRSRYKRMALEYIWGREYTTIMFLTYSF